MPSLAAFYRLHVRDSLTGVNLLVAKRLNMGTLHATTNGNDKWDIGGTIGDLADTSTFLDASGAEECHKRQ